MTESAATEMIDQLMTLDMTDRAKRGLANAALDTLISEGVQALQNHLSEWERTDEDERKHLAQHHEREAKVQFLKGMLAALGGNVFTATIRGENPSDTHYDMDFHASETFSRTVFMADSEQGQLFWYTKPEHVELLSEFIRHNYPDTKFEVEATTDGGEHLHRNETRRR